MEIITFEEIIKTLKPKRQNVMDKIKEIIIYRTPIDNENDEHDDLYEVFQSIIEETANRFYLKGRFDCRKEIRDNMELPKYMEEWE